MTITQLTTLQNKFRWDPDWLGADGFCSVMLSPSRRVWFVCDSLWKGTPQFTGNSVGVQDYDGIVKFYRGANRGDFFAKPANADVFWPSTCIYLGGYLYVVGAAINRSQEYGVRVHSVARYVSNPLADPSIWKINDVDTPWPEGPVIDSGFDGHLMVDKERKFLYAYGHKALSAGENRPILARTSLNAFLDGAPVWMFFTGADMWGYNPTQVSLLWGDVKSGNAYDVHYDQRVDKYFAYFIPDPIWNNVVYRRSAPNPWGPWGAVEAVFRAAPAFQPGVTSYFPHYHPSLGVGVYSVSCNRKDDPSVYLPWFYNIT